MEIPLELINLVNTSFYLYEAADMCIREAERRLPRLNGGGFKFETKRKFNNIKAEMSRLKYYVESFLDEYNESFDDKTIAKGTENVRRIASLYARLALLISDRCNHGDGTKERHILQVIENMPPQGNITEHTLERLTLE